MEQRVETIPLEIFLKVVSSSGIFSLKEKNIERVTFSRNSKCVNFERYDATLRKCVIFQTLEPRLILIFKIYIAGFERPITICCDDAKTTFFDEQYLFKIIPQECDSPYAQYNMLIPHCSINSMGWTSGALGNILGFIVNNNFEELESKSLDEFYKPRSDNSDVSDDENT
jgi:hypothetical protein